MLCHKDKTFCASDCVNRSCHRFFGEMEEAGSRAWLSHDPDNAPVAFIDFSKTCKDYKAEGQNG